MNDFKYFVKCRHCGAILNIDDHHDFLDALNFVKGEGWDLDDGRCLCPNCTKHAIYVSYNEQADTYHTSFEDTDYAYCASGITKEDAINNIKNLLKENKVKGINKMFVVEVL